MNYEIRIISEEDTIKSKIYENLDSAINVAQSVYNNFINFDFGDEIVVAEANSKDKKYLWANGKRIIEDLKVGDIVKVVDEQQGYTTYVDFMTTYGTKKDCGGWVYNKPIPDDCGSAYEIVCIAPHIDRPNEGNLAIIKSYNKYNPPFLPSVYIVHIEGLKKV